ncbi:unnamed protein product [Phaeothamnion confervicola]
MLWETLRVPQKDLPVRPISMGSQTVIVEVASAPKEIARGLMYRESIHSDQGMLFVFEQVKSQCFWMKNTSIPLTAAFITEGGVIQHLADMEPKSLQLHCSPGDVKAVVEMSQGWFRDAGVLVGSRVVMPADFR